ncbi:hypothetical protein TIFTF001_055129 [Ficus carica]|uniref:Uncharacterized protein n=1 Tax=Ficus carica TaxID=3494 RepID=A0AA88EC92_FICCA|nr:hypothetical protein TIFTF001_055129 [Ficus carica]
MRAYALYA